MEKLITKLLFLAASIAIPLVLVRNDPDYSWVWFGPAPLFLIMTLEEVYKSKFTRSLAAIAIGLFVGAVVSYLFGKMFNATYLLPALAVVICYVFVSYALQISREIRFSLPFVDLRDESKKSDGLVLDVSALVDGRLFELYRAGVLDKRLYIPKFVQNELQKISNAEDKTQRTRGLRGTEVLKNILGNPSIPAVVHESELDNAPGSMEERLVKTAQTLNGRIATTDLNMCKAALAQGISVINLNDLGSAMRATVVYGEKLTLDVVKPGKDSGQGVGYLEDGTMVVVENGRGYIGQKVEITVTSFSQTVAGKMIFGRIEGATRDLRESAPRTSFAPRSQQPPRPQQNAPRPQQTPPAQSQSTPPPQQHRDGGFDKNRPPFQKGPDRRRHDQRGGFNRDARPDERRTDERKDDRGTEKREERRDDFRDKKEEAPKPETPVEKKPLPSNPINPYALNIEPLESREPRVEKKPAPPQPPQQAAPPATPPLEEAPKDTRDKSSGSTQHKFGEGLDLIDEV